LHDDVVCMNFIPAVLYRCRVWSNTASAFKRACFKRQKKEVERNVWSCHQYVCKYVDFI